MRVKRKVGEDNERIMNWKAFHSHLGESQENQMKIDHIDHADLRDHAITKSKARQCGWACTVMQLTLDN